MRTRTFLLIFVTLLTVLATGCSSSSDSMEVAEQVEINELLDLVKMNTVAAHQYEGKLILADGLVSHVDSEAVVVVHADDWLELPVFNLSMGGFFCHLRRSQEDSASELRSGDPITITGTIASWDTDGNAHLDKCEFGPRGYLDPTPTRTYPSLP